MRQRSGDLKEDLTDGALKNVPGGSNHLGIACDELLHDTALRLHDGADLRRVVLTQAAKQALDSSRLLHRGGRVIGLNPLLEGLADREGENVSFEHAQVCFVESITAVRTGAC